MPDAKNPATEVDLSPYLKPSEVDLSAYYDALGDAILTGTGWLEFTADGVRCANAGAAVIDANPDVLAALGLVFTEAGKH